MRVTYTIDEVAFNRVLKQEVKDHQELFRDDLAQPLREAARRVIYGNFTGKGGYSPRPIGTFTSPRAREHRGWIEGNYRSQRAYQLSGGRRVGAKPQAFDALRSTALLQAVSQLSASNPAYRKVSEQARSALQGGSPAGDQVKGFLKSGLGQIMASRAQRPPVRRASNMRYGVQTGRLAGAWKDLRVTPTGVSDLRFRLDPAMGSLSGSPDAAKLTTYLSHNRGWKGLMDHHQLVEALRDQGVVVLD